MSEIKEGEKNVNAVNNNQNASQQGISSIVTDRVNENPEQHNNLINQLNINPEQNTNQNPNMKSISTIPQSTAYPNSNWVILESILERNGLATKPTTFSLEVIGIYSLPEFWVKMDQSGAVDNWGYQVKIGEAKCVNGKYNQRELTEEEKYQAENKKKPPPKIDKKNPEAVKAEEERLKKIQDEKDLKEKETIKTDKGKTNTENSQNDGDYIEEAHTYIYYKLKFNESINPKIKDLEENVENIDNKEKEENKNVNLESNKLIDNIVTISEKENENINKSQPEEKKEEILEEKKEEILEEKKEDENKIKLEQQKNAVENNRYEKEVEKTKKILEEKVEEKLEEEESNIIGADEICSDFRKYIKIFIESICKSYDELIGGDSSKNQAARRDKVGSMISNVKKEERDLNINKFLNKFIENGKANVIKEKLKKFIIKIALEKYKKRIEVNEKFDEQRDKFFSEIYAYICEEIKLGMDEYIYMKRDEIHEHILSSYDQSRKEIINYAIRKTKEPEEKRLLRLSNEYEILDDLKTAMLYYKSRLTLVQTQESWLGFAILSKKMNNLTNVEEAIKYCLNNILENEHMISPGNTSLTPQQKNDEFTFKILHSSIKYLKGRMKDALSIMIALLEKYSLKKTNCNFNAFLAFLYHENKNKLLFTKHYEAAKRFKMIELGIDLRKPKFNPKIKLTYKTPSLTGEQTNSIWYNLINLFNQYEFYEISNKLLEFIDTEGKNTVEYKIQQVKISLFFKDYDKAISICDNILKENNENYLAWILRGNAFYYKKNLFDSEESYIKGIKYKPRNSKFDIKMLTRLGIIYIGRKTWKDAKTVFLHILKESSLHSFAWRYLGLALTHLEEYSAAEEALNEGISLDIENPHAWAYLNIFCIKVKRNEQAMACLNELIKMKFKDVGTIATIAALFYNNGENNIAANLYRRIILIDKTFIDAQIKLAEIYFMKFEDKKKEAIDILKNAIPYAMDEKEKNGIIELISIYENQAENNNSDFDNMLHQNDSENAKMEKMDFSVHSKEDSEVKDNFS